MWWNWFYAPFGISKKNYRDLILVLALLAYMDGRRKDAAALLVLLYLVTREE